jgi:uncharacterized protein with PIN domain
MGLLVIDVAPELRQFLAPRDRHDAIRQPHDGTSSLGHVVESIGVPLPEVGRLLVRGCSVEPSYRPVDGDEVQVLPVRRPQAAPPSFMLDVHLGVLARRLRLLGVDTAYANDADDDALIEQANRERRALLTQDRALLRRRRLWLGAYVRGSRPDDQLRDVLDRFAPPLSPWTRCPACNGPLADVPKSAVEHLLERGTRQTYDTFAQCRACGRPYWKGAHHARLARIVAEAEGREVPDE